MNVLSTRIAAFAVAAAAATAALPARADIITALSAAPTLQSNGYYAYTYNVQLSGGQLDATDGNGAAATPSQFGTVYDFGALELTDGTTTSGASVLFSATGLLASSFVFTFANLSTPTVYATAPTDSASLANIRFTYDGTTNYVIAGQTTTLTNTTALQPGSSNLGTFTIYSPLGSFSTTTNNYDGQTYKGGNNTIQGNVGLVGTPIAATTVPEPATLALLGTGLAGLIASRRRRA